MYGNVLTVKCRNFLFENVKQLMKNVLKTFCVFFWKSEFAYFSTFGILYVNITSCQFCHFWCLFRCPKSILSGTIFNFSVLVDSLLKFMIYKLTQTKQFSSKTHAQLSIKRFIDFVVFTSLHFTLDLDSTNVIWCFNVFSWKHVGFFVINKCM